MHTRYVPCALWQAKDRKGQRCKGEGGVIDSVRVVLLDFLGEAGVREEEWGGEGNRGREESKGLVGARRIPLFFHAQEN